MKCSQKKLNNKKSDGLAAFSQNSLNMLSVVPTNDINSVQRLLYCPVPFNQRLLVKEKGRPTPDLNIRITTDGMNRKFHNKVYAKYEWMCGCPITNRLFCFVCLLFRKEVTAWAQHGVNDLKHLAERARKHEDSIYHLNAWVDYKLLGETDIREQLNPVYLRNKLKHNENVETNRQLLRKLIMCVKFCGAFELASDNSGICGGLINFAAELDSVLAVHMKSATAFEGTSTTIQKELLDAMFEVYRNELIKQIKSASFVALEADETTDSSNQRQMVIIMRYVYNWQICERFWSFVKLEGHTADQLANVLLSELQHILEIPSDKFKLIAQSCNGSSTMTGVQDMIRKTFPRAYFIHSYAHEFNSIMEQAAQCHKNLKIFLGNLQSFTRFFSWSPQRAAVLDVVPIDWDFKSRTVNTLFEHRESFRKRLETIIDAEGVDPKTASEACGLLKRLNCPEFLYWLKLFSLIMPHVETLFIQAQSHDLETVQLENAVNQFEQQIIRVKSITANTEHDNEEEPDIKRQRTLSAGDAIRIVAKQVCDNILTQIKDRFDFKGYLSATKLFDSKEFNTYRRTFPQKYFDETVTSYPEINSVKLKTELTAVYCREDMRAINGVLPLLVFIVKNNLKKILCETYKLLDIICTTPMPTSECARSFSTMKSIKTFLRSTVIGDRGNALAVLSNEKKFVQCIPDFDNKVVEVFCNSKDRRKDFLYK